MSVSVGLRGSTLRLMVLWYICIHVCMCRECGELPWPRPGAPLTKVFVVAHTGGGGVIHGGDPTPYVLPDSPSMNKAC